MKPIEVKFETVLHLGIAILVVFAFVIFCTFQLNTVSNPNILAFLPMLSLLMFYVFNIVSIVLSRSAIFSAERIRLETNRGSFEIRTDDIEYIENGFGRMRIGNRQQILTVPDVAYWSHKASEDFSNLFLKHLELRGVVPKFSLRACWPRYKNCRVR